MTTLSSHRSRLRGFTLVELLVVVSIIALLISILLPSLSKAREQAKLVKCVAHQRGLAQAGLIFSQDHQNKFQLVTNGEGIRKADPNKREYEYTSQGELLSWPVALAQAMKIDIRENWNWGFRASRTDLSQVLASKTKASNELDIALCPADKVGLATPFYPNGLASANAPGMLVGTGNPEYPVPAAPDIFYWGKLSFGINEDVVGSEVFGGAPAVGRWFKGPRTGNVSRWQRGEIHGDAGERLQGNLDRAFEPSSLLLLIDAGPNDESEFTGGEADNARDTGFANLIITSKALGPNLEDVVKQWPRRIPFKRHIGGRVNVIFGDYHGETISPVAWFTSSFGGGIKLPSKFGTKVRVSPYRPYPSE